MRPVEATRWECQTTCVGLEASGASVVRWSFIARHTQRLAMARPIVVNMTITALERRDFSLSSSSNAVLHCLVVYIQTMDVAGPSLKQEL